jgi:hypothetical protein
MFIPTNSEMSVRMLQIRYRGVVEYHDIRDGLPV